jgi:hypothetical protein
MQKYLSIVLAILLVWGSSCDHDETRIQQVATEKKITITDLEHEPAVKELLSNVQGVLPTEESAVWKLQTHSSNIANPTAAS